MFGTIRKLLEALQHISAALSEIDYRLRELTIQHDEGPPLLARVEELERTRELWEATAEATLTRGTTEFNKARAAEERSKTVLKNAEALAGSDDGEEGLPEWYENLLRGNVEAGPEEGVPPVSAHVAPHTRNSAALAAKFHR